MSLKFTGPFGLGVPIRRGPQKPIFSTLTGSVTTRVLFLWMMLVGELGQVIRGLTGRSFSRTGLSYRWPQKALSCLVVV